MNGLKDMTWPHNDSEFSDIAVGEFRVFSCHETPRCYGEVTRCKRCKSIVMYCHCGESDTYCTCDYDEYYTGYVRTE